MSLDGPRDNLKEIKAEMREGPIYDKSKVDLMQLKQKSALEARQKKAASELMAVEYQGLKIDTAPPSENMGETELWKYLENNYNYAKRIESAIDIQRSKVAAELLHAQQRLQQAR